MTAIIEIKLIMQTSIVDEQIKSRTQIRNMNSTMISNRKDRNTYGATEAAPLALRKRLPRLGKKSSSVKSSLSAVARLRSPNFNSTAEWIA